MAKLLGGERSLPVRRGARLGGRRPPDSPRPYPRPDITPAQVDYWLSRLGIAAVSDKYPNQISGGQRQRTAIARSLLQQPNLLLMDEPFSSLDALTREDLQRLTVELRAETGLTTVVVTHIIEEAVEMLKSGGLILFPTTQLYGLGADALNAEREAAFVGDDFGFQQPR